jgi:hypothetical protein
MASRLKEWRRCTVPRIVLEESSTSRRLRRIATAAVLILFVTSAVTNADDLLEGEFGQLNLGRSMIAANRLPTVREVRKLASRPQIETVLLLKLHGDKNNHHLPIWSDDGLRLAFQRSDLALLTSKLLLFQSLSDEKPLLVETEEGAYDHMFRWGVNAPSSYVFARTARDSKATQIYFSLAGNTPVAKTQGAARHVYPTIYKRTDGIWRLIYERDGQLVHDAWREDQEIESGKLIGRGSLPRWDGTGTQLLVAREREGTGRRGAYDVVIRNLRSETEIIVPVDATDDVRSPCWSPDEQFVSFYHRKSGESHPWRIALTPIADVSQVHDLGEQVVMNMDFESPGPAWESTGERIWFFSHAKHKQAYYPLIAVDTKTGVLTEVDYPERCTTPNDLAINPLADIPEIAFVAHAGITQDLFIVLLNHF